MSLRPPRGSGCFEGDVFHVDVGDVFHEVTVPDDCGPGSTLHIRIPLSTEIVRADGADDEAVDGDDEALRGILEEMDGAARLSMPTIGEEASPTSTSPSASFPTEMAASTVDERASSPDHLETLPQHDVAADRGAEGHPSEETATLPRRRSLFRRLSGSRKAKR